jgi:putative ABC transport system substrate-binding protein
MKRREFITLLGGAAAWPLAAWAQQTLKVVGILDPGIPHLIDAFFQGMRDLGHVEGQNVNYVRRSAEGKADRIPTLANELVRMKPNVILTAAPLPVRALKEATSTIPIVFAALGDALTSGAVSDFARPGGNLTGLSFLNIELSGKRLEILHEAMPNLRRIAIFYDPNTDPDYLRVSEETGRKLGLEFKARPLPGVDAFESAHEAARADGAEAIDVLASAFFNANRVRLIELAAKYRLPAIYETGEYVRSGGFMSYGPSLEDLFRRSATYVDKILKGATPGDLPVEQPTKFELVINLKTAKALGLEVPPTLLARADEVIE